MVINTLKGTIEDSGNKIIATKILGVIIIIVGFKLWFTRGVS